MPQYKFIATGYLFVAVNLQINGLGLIFPTCFGYALIGLACWSLRDRYWSFRFASFPAAILALLTFPDLFRGAAQGTEAYYDWILWPSITLELLLMAFVASGLWYEADSKGIGWLRWAVIALAPIAIVSLLAWWYFPVSSNATLIASFLIYVIPAFYLAAVNAGAAKSLA